MKMYSRYCLLKRIVQSKKLIKKIVCPLHEEGVLPYEEKASPTNIVVTESTAATELFNQFTADIIREEKIFVR